MKPENIYQALKDLAEKLDIGVSEQNLRKTGIHVNSGLCKVKGEWVFVMDKHETIHNKIELLAACLGGMPTDDIYVVPAIREIIQRMGKRVHKDFSV